MGDYTDIEITGKEEDNQVAKKLIDELVGNVSGNCMPTVSEDASLHQCRTVVIVHCRGSYRILARVGRLFGR